MKIPGPRRPRNRPQLPPSPPGYIDIARVDIDRIEGTSDRAHFILRDPQGAPIGCGTAPASDLRMIVAGWHVNVVFYAEHHCNHIPGRNQNA